MKKEEAIERLKQNKAAAEFYVEIAQNIKPIENELKDIEAFDMAIEALQTETISLSVADKIGEEREWLQEKVAELQEEIADRPHGEWVDENGNKVPLDKDGYPLGSCWCNQCHEWLVGSDEYAIKGNFCPSCGVNMRERRKI